MHSNESVPSASLLSSQFAELIRRNCPPLTKFDCACLAIYLPPLVPAMHDPARPPRIEDFGVRGLEVLIRLARTIPGDLRRCGLLPQLAVPFRVAVCFALTRLVDWVDGTRVAPPEGLAGLRQRQIRAIISDTVEQHTDVHELLRDLAQAGRRIGLAGNSDDVRRLAAQVEASRRDILFPSRRGRWRVGNRQVRDLLELGLPRTRPRTKAAADKSIDRAASPNPNAHGRAPAATRARPLVSGFDRLSTIARLERLARLSERERTVVELSVQTDADSVGWGSREHHRRVVDAGFDISRTGLREMCIRLQQKLAVG